MAGFLDRLAARALGEVPLAEPLIPARFTPGSNPGEGIASASEHVTASSQACEGHEYESLQNARKFAKNSSTGRPEAGIDQQREVRLASPPQRIQGKPHDEHSALQFALPERSKPLDPVSTSITTSSSAERLPKTMREIPFMRAPFAEASPARLEERHVPDQLSAQRDSLSQRPSSPTPVVRVTIGRIDVRAELANAPAAPVARPRTPTVSLDQFLKQRSSGKR